VYEWQEFVDPGRYPSGNYSVTPTGACTQNTTENNHRATPGHMKTILLPWMAGQDTNFVIYLDTIKII